MDSVSSVLRDLTDYRLYYLLKYPPSTSSIRLADSASEFDTSLPTGGLGKGYDGGERRRGEEKKRIQVAGAFVLCPMVGGESKEIRIG